MWSGVGGGMWRGVLVLEYRTMHVGLKEEGWWRGSLSTLLHITLVEWEGYDAFSNDFDSITDLNKPTLITAVRERNTEPHSIKFTKGPGHPPQLPNLWK